MTNRVRTIGRKIIQHLPFGNDVIGYLRWRLYSVYKVRLIPKAGIFYKRNVETGLIDTEERGEDGTWEYPDMIITNQLIGDKWISSDVKYMVNIGSGVATFESLHAQKHPDIQFVASEMDRSSTMWAKSNRSYPNVKYCTDSMDVLLHNLGGKKFDLAVTIDVIEHVADYKTFLDEFSQLADRAVISTPNRDMDIALSRGPLYKAHVQEFNAGELFFILKMYYRKVELYSLPDPLKKNIIPVGLYSSYEKLIAYCER